MALRYFLFDLDGVLINACDWHYECLNMAMEQVVGFSISRQDHMRREKAVHPEEDRHVQTRPIKD
jgi:beta-phosphoglucomutase-like phosphatase (HAD superfamily)